MKLERSQAGVLSRAATHAALADPTRLAIVEDLAFSDRSPSELGAMLGIGSSLLAHHLGVLEDAGLIRRLPSHGDGRRRYLRLAARPPIHPPETIAADGLLFVCTHNAARSQLAEAAWNERHAVPAGSAGTRPASEINPGAEAAARRRGLALGHARPRPLGNLDRLPPLVVTVCDRAHEEIEAWPDEVRVLHWSTADPAERGTPHAFDRAADEIVERVDGLAPHVVPPS